MHIASGHPCSLKPTYGSWSPYPKLKQKKKKKYIYIYIYIWISTLPYQCFKQLKNADCPGKESEYLVPAAAH